MMMMCEIVSVAQSVGGGTGTTMTQQTEEEAKTNTGNMATDRTPLEPEPSCLVGTSGTAPTPGVTEWSLTLPQPLINADSVGGDGQGSIYCGEARPQTRDVEQRGAASSAESYISIRPFPAPSLTVYCRRMNLMGEGKRWSNPGSTRHVQLDLKFRFPFKLLPK